MSQSAYAKATQGVPFVNCPPGYGHSQPATTGWTSPPAIYEKMRQVNGSAKSLNGDVAANVRRAAFVTAWNAWFASWSAFFQKYQGTMARFSALTFTDELFQQVLSYETQLVSWYDAYGREKDGDKPVPPASGAPPVPNVPIPPSRDLPKPPGDEGLVVPWWAWAIGIVVVAGAGYATYRYIKHARAVKSVLDEKVVPQVLHVYGGPMGGQFAQGYQQLYPARDPSTGAPVIGAPIMSTPQMDLPVPYARYPGT